MSRRAVHLSEISRRIVGKKKKEFVYLLPPKLRPSSHPESNGRLTPVFSANTDVNGRDSFLLAILGLFRGSDGWVLRVGRVPSGERETWVQRRIDSCQVVSVAGHAPEQSIPQQDAYERFTYPTRTETDDVFEYRWMTSWSKICVSTSLDKSRTNVKPIIPDDGESFFSARDGGQDAQDGQPTLVDGRTGKKKGDANGRGGGGRVTCPPDAGTWSSAVQPSGGCIAESRGTREFRGCLGSQLDGRDLGWRPCLVVSAAGQSLYLGAASGS